MAKWKVALVLAFLVQRFKGYAEDDFFLVTASVPGSSVGGSILSIEPYTYDEHYIDFSSRLYNPIAVDYDPVDRMVYWTDVGLLRRICRASLTDGLVETVFSGYSNSVMDGLAVDADERLIFFSDTGLNRIGRMSMSYSVPAYIVTSDLDEPRAIVLDTDAQVIFWTDWGADPKIERASYDGTARSTLVSTGLYFVNALALDAPQNKLYWVDAGTDKIEMYDLGENDRTTLLSVGSGYHFFGLALFEGSLYTTDWTSVGSSTDESHLIRMHLDGSGAYIVATLREGRMNDIHAYQSGAQPLAVTQAQRIGGVAVLASLLALIIA